MRIIGNLPVPFQPGSVVIWGAEDFEVISADVVCGVLTVFTTQTREATRGKPYRISVKTDSSHVDKDDRHVATVVDRHGFPFHVFWREGT